MSDIDLILELLEVRARHLSGSAFMYAQVHDLDDYTDTPSAPAREDLYEAQATALRDFAAEIKAGMATSVGVEKAPSGQKDTCELFIQEMAGTMTATAYRSWVDLKAREARFAAEHEAYFESNGNGVYHTVLANITPRKSGASDTGADTKLDVRWVFITDVNRSFDAVICDTQDELQSARDEFKREHKDWIKSQDAVCTSHEILIPPKP